MGFGHLAISESMATSNTAAQYTWDTGSWDYSEGNTPSDDSFSCKAFESRKKEKEKTTPSGIQPQANWLARLASTLHFVSCNRTNI